MMAVMNISTMLEYGCPSGMLRKIGGVGARDTGAGGLAVKVSKKSQVPVFRDKDSEEKCVDMDDEGAPQASPTLSDANMPVELPVSFKLALELAFSMLSFVLRNPTRKASPFARSTLNPYLSVMLTFLATVTKHAEMLSMMEHSIPWHDLVRFFATIPHDIFTMQGLFFPLVISLKPTVTCVRWCQREVMITLLVVPSALAISTIAMPPLNTLSLADLEQLELQELKDFNKELTEENKILKANQLKRKKKGQNVSEGHMAFDEEIRLCGCKYGACYKMFAPDRQLLQRPNPTFAPPLNELSHYETQASAESALLAELFSLLPSHIHHLVGDNHFADIFKDAMNSSRASEIKKLRSKAGLIFGLPEQYFTDTAYIRASVPEIHHLLGTSTSQCMPKPFPPILFPNLVEDPLLKTVFGNWEIFGKAIQILLWGESGLTAVRAGRPPRNGNKWEVTSLTPSLLASPFSDKFHIIQATRPT
ncbi:hypothetical protein BDR05DRAFT_989001 [Suillus weaverae]|nr:hypothetical protein BDR05DRAFT_989001 [Suillus weaverae]